MMEDRGRPHLHAVGRGAAIPRRLWPLLILQRGTLVVGHLLREGAGWDTSLGVAVPHPATLSALMAGSITCSVSTQWG